MVRRACLLASLLLLLLLPVVALAGDATPPTDTPTAARASIEQRLQALDDVADAEVAPSAYRLALEAQAAGLDDLAKKAFARVIEADPDHPAARRALGFEQVDGRWLEGDDLWRAKGFVHHAGRWLTAEEFAAATRPEREAAAQRAGEEHVMGLLGMISSERPERVREAARQIGLEDARFLLAPLAKALRCKPASLRVFAARTLARLADPLAVPALLKRAVEDPDADVRHECALALREIGAPSTIYPLGRALDSRYAEVRAHAAEAIATLGDELGMGYVLVKWEKRSGDFPRAYFASIRQISYIQDFDVEVAQTSFIADPIVGTLQEGAVQAVKVVATEQTFYALEVPAYANAMAKLSGEDFGKDVGAWHRWWKENEKRLMEQRAARLEQAAADHAER